VEGGEMKKVKKCEFPLCLKDAATNENFCKKWACSNHTECFNPRLGQVLSDESVMEHEKQKDKTKTFQSENETLQSWAKHHQQCVELSRERENKLQSENEALKKKLEVAREALKTIKHTECDTYRVSADALFKTKLNEAEGRERV
jgi:hypothetical protein